MESIGDGQFHVLVIGAGSVGCLIAQRCKLLNIKCTLFERENYLNERPRDWNYGIYTAEGPLKQCLPEEISSRLATATVDPIRGLSEKDCLPIFNGKTGELLNKWPTPNILRLSRSRFRALIAEGLDIQVSICLIHVLKWANELPKYGKRLSSISCPDDSSTVTAHFEDGSTATGNLLVGADGANSRVREFLFGPEKSALQTLPLLGIGALESLPADAAGRIREINDIYVLSYHPEGPEGVCCFISLHDVPDAAKPETWKWMLYLTWNDKSDEVPSGAEPLRQLWTRLVQTVSEPIRSAYLSIPSDAKLWCDRLAEWRTVPWDNRNCRVTLVGDAAHPMTYHRGQGLNNGIQDAASICRHLDEHLRNGKAFPEMLADYEKEMQERGREAVISSGQNSLMVHDWEQLKKSPIFTMGLGPQAKRQ